MDLTGHLPLGTPFYMAPEQVRSSTSADSRSDIWSLGVVLYEMLTIVDPFQAETLTEVCAAVLELDPRPLTEVRPEVPAGLADVVARCLAKDRGARFQNVAELANALAPFAPSRALVCVEKASSVLRVGYDAGTPSGIRALPASGASNVGASTDASAVPLVTPAPPPASNGGLGSWRTHLRFVAALTVAGLAIAYVGRGRSADAKESAMTMTPTTAAVLVAQPTATMSAVAGPDTAASASAVTPPPTARVSERPPTPRVAATAHAPASSRPVSAVGETGPGQAPSAQPRSPTPAPAAPSPQGRPDLGY